MTISLPDMFTADNSEKYIMSIRLRSDGLFFSGYIPKVGETFFYQDFLFDKSIPYIDALKEYFYANDFFNWHFKKISILTDTSFYTLVPESAYQKKKNEELLSFVFTSHPSRVLGDYLQDEKAYLVYGIDNEVYEFCNRSFLNPVFIHSLTPVFTLCQQQSRINLSAQMYAIIGEKKMDIIVYVKDKLTFANSFETKAWEDYLYYILYIWKQNGLSQQNDLLFLSGENKTIQSLNQALNSYLRQIQPIKIPTEAYLLGNNIQQVPLDIIALSVCE
ncbi:DUF3822 family protein [Parabacteroides sp. OttesenSCG-928-G21]|nr:DUF3822 family protein [Parabacteroides sp. OttesenSCG-928-G21]